MERRYHALRVVGSIYQALAILAILATLFAVLTGIPYGIFRSLLIGGIITLSLFAIGEAIDVFLGIEENTRRQADAMERWITSQTPPAH